MDFEENLDDWIKHLKFSNYVDFFRILNSEWIEENLDNWMKHLHVSDYAEFFFWSG